MLADISQLEALQENFGHSGVSSDLSIFNPESYQVENAPLDLSSNQNGMITLGAVKPVAPVTPVMDGAPLPQWKKTVDERLGNLERNFGNMKTEMANMKTEIKADMNKLKTEIITEIKQAVTPR